MYESRDVRAEERCAVNRQGSRGGKSLVGRLTISILAIWLPFSAAVIIGMATLSGRITEDTINNQTDKVKYYSAIINADIARVIQSTNQLCANKFIVDFTDTWKGTMESGYYRLYHDAYSTLKEYRDTSICINDIFIYLPYAGEILSANQSVIAEDGIYRTMREDYMKSGQKFFHYGDALYYLSQSSNEMITGIKVSLQDIRYMLRDYDSEGSYDYFFVNALTKELLDAEESVGDIGREIYEGIDWGRKSAQEIEIGRRKYLVDRIGKDANGFLILIYMDKSEAYDNIYAMYKVWGGATLLLLFVPVVLGLCVRRIIHSPMEKLQKAMQMVEQENYSYLLAMDESREFNYVFAQYNQMTEKVRNLIQEVLEKQVQVDGASYLQRFGYLVIPLSKPVIATVTLFSFSSHWNSWFDGKIYNNQTTNYPLQTYLQNLISSSDMTNAAEAIENALSNVKTLQAAQLVLTLLPILLIYPFLQKYFVKGITVGAVKG